MFYSHEVLTSRKYGVATVWLVATLGSKSTLKRVSRKAILDVDVAKACDTIVQPEAPMALRLQSNLLYGVARVYSQQCGYVLSDAEAAKNNMRAMFRVMRTSGLEAEGGTKGRAENLLLQDDPNFLPDFDLVPLDLDQLDFGLDITSAAAGESQGSTLSPHNSQLTGSQHSLPRLNIPGRSSSLIGGPVGAGGSFGVRGDSGAGMRHDELFLDDDLGITVDADGTMRFSDGPVRQPAAPSGRADRTDLGLMSSVARSGHGGVAAGQDMLGQLDDDGFMLLQDDDNIFPQVAEAFPPRDAAEGAQQTHTTSETAEAPARRRNKPAPKVIAPDSSMELRNGDLARWNTDYVANMHEAMRHKHANRMTAIAKENARHWVLGAGGLGALSQSDMLVNGPLGMFSGAKLLETLTGLDLTGTGGEKRNRDASDEGSDDRRKRHSGEPSSDAHELGRGELQQYDDGYLPIDGDDYTAIEQGREAPTPLDDRHLSSIFPWNQSTGSRRPTGIFTSASLPAGGPGGLVSRRASRLPTASPLVGRGALPGAEIGVGDAFEQRLYSEQSAAAVADNDLVMSGLDDFELFGPAAQVDTQTAAQSQWQRAALDTESGNFMEFVQAAIADMDIAREQAGPGDEDDEALKGTVEFESLLPPESNTRVVAAQGLLHVLALATKGMLKVEQAEPFTEISMRAIAV